MSELILNYPLSKIRVLFSKILIFSALTVLIVDTIYKYYNGITYLSRQNCILFSTLPRWAFLIYEYFFELIMLVLVGIFTAALVEKYFLRLNKIIPHNMFTAFLYASILPVCSCGVVPLSRTLQDKIPLRVMVTFIISAPLLNPYILVLSATVLGIRYMLLRIVCSFILAISIGYIAEAFGNLLDTSGTNTGQVCSSGKSCRAVSSDVYASTLQIFKMLIPFLAIAAILGIGMEMFAEDLLLPGLKFDNHLAGMLLVIFIGIPVYFCNGADVLFLKPFVVHNNLPLSTAMAFSLTSTSICISSIVLLTKFIGKKLTIVILISIALVTILLCLLIQLIPIPQISLFE